MPGDSGTAGAGVGSDSAAEAVRSAPHFGQVVGHSGVVTGAGVLLLSVLALSLGSKVAILLVPREKFLCSGYSRSLRC